MYELEVFSCSIETKPWRGPEIGQQWFDKFLVTFPDDTPIVKVGIGLELCISPVL